MPAADALTWPEHLRRVMEQDLLLRAQNMVLERKENGEVLMLTKSLAELTKPLAELAKPLAERSKPLAELTRPPRCSSAKRTARCSTSKASKVSSTHSLKLLVYAALSY